MENYFNSVTIFASPLNHGVKNRNMKTSESKKDLYQKIYAEYFSRIAAYAFSFLKDKEEADNIANDTFLSLWENREKLNWEENLSPWLFSVARNKSFNTLKKRMHSHNYKKNSIKEKSDYLNFLALQSESPVKIYEKEVEKLLCLAVEKMTPKVRTTFILSRLKGLKYSEIAEIHNISNRTVEARIKLAMLILRKTFKDYL